MTPLGGVFLAGLLIPGGLVVVAGLVILVAATVSGGRRDADPTGERATATFLAITTWVTMFIVLFAAFAIVATVVGYIHSGEGGRLVSGLQNQTFAQGSSGSFSIGSGSSNSAPLIASTSSRSNGTSTGLAAGLVGLTAFGVLALYGPRLRTLVSDAAWRTRPAGPPLQVYLLAATFTAVFIAFGAAASALFGLYRLLAPGVAGDLGAHGPGLRQLLDSLFLAAGAALIFIRHHRLAFPRPTPPE